MGRPEDKPERDKHELEPETVEDLDPNEEEGEDIRGGGFITLCGRMSLMERL